MLHVPGAPAVVRTWFAATSVPVGVLAPAPIAEPDTMSVQDVVCQSPPLPPPPPPGLHPHLHLSALPALIGTENLTRWAACTPWIV